jgi:DNA-binding beta-propeller fold protein YncE
VIVTFQLFLLFGWQQKSILGDFVRKFESASVWADLAFTPDGQFVLGLGFDPACVYVCKADTLAVVREIGKAYLKNGERLSLTPDGLVLVSDCVVHCVWVFRLDGTLVRQIGSKGNGNGQLERPFRTTCSTTGQVYVAEGDNHRMSVFNLADGSFVRHIGSAGSGNGQLKTPDCVALSPDEKELFVADWGNGRVQVFSMDGRYLRQWGKAGAGPGEFDCPECVLVTAAGEVLVTDCDNHRIQLFGLDGTFKRSFGSEGDGPGQFEKPFTMALSFAGELYITDLVSNRVHVFR